MAAGLGPKQIHWLYSAGRGLDELNLRAGLFTCSKRDRYDAVAGTRWSVSARAPKSPKGLNT